MLAIRLLFIYENRDVYYAGQNFANLLLILSHIYVGSMFLMRCIHLTQSCTSSPDSTLSDKSFLNPDGVQPPPPRSSSSFSRHLHHHHSLGTFTEHCHISIPLNVVN